MPYSKHVEVKIVKTTGLTGYGNSLSVGSKFIENEYVALMNSDDYIHPLRFKFQLEMLRDSDISITQLQGVTTGGAKRRSMLLNYEASEYSPSFLLLGSFGANASWTMRSQWWRENAFFDSDAALDWRIALSSFRNSRISFVPRKLYFYRKHSLQKTNEPIGKDSLQKVFKLWNEFLTSYGFSEGNFEIFSSAACPWLPELDFDIAEFLTWAQTVATLFEFDEELLKLYWQMIYRRCLLLYRHDYKRIISDFKQVRLLAPYFPSLLRDYLDN